MNDLHVWMNGNDTVMVVNGFKQDLVRSLILDLAPRVLKQRWLTRAA